MMESPDRSPGLGGQGGAVESGSPAAGVVGADVRSGRPGRGGPRPPERKIRDLVPSDQPPPSGTVELRSGVWQWTVRGADGGDDPLEGVTLLLTDPADPRRRMEVPGLPRNGLGESEVPYFARRAEVRRVPVGPGEFVVRVVRLPIDLATPFGTRVGLRIRVQTPSGAWREGTLAPGVRLGDLTDEEVIATAERARPLVRPGL